MKFDSRLDASSMDLEIRAYIKHIPDDFKGYVYVLANPLIPNLVKIGYSKHDPRIRAAKLCGTGVPGKWEVQYYAFVEDPKFVEGQAHGTLWEHHADKEFFSVSPENAARTIRGIIGISIEHEFSTFDLEGIIQSPTSTQPPADPPRQPERLKPPRPPYRKPKRPKPNRPKNEPSPPSCVIGDLKPTNVAPWWMSFPWLGTIFWLGLVFFISIRWSEELGALGAILLFISFIGTLFRHAR